MIVTEEISKNSGYILQTTEPGVSTRHSAVKKAEIIICINQYQQYHQIPGHRCHKIYHGDPPFPYVPGRLPVHTLLYAPLKMTSCKFALQLHRFLMEEGLHVGIQHFPGLFRTLRRKCQTQHLRLQAGLSHFYPSKATGGWNCRSYCSRNGTGSLPEIPSFCDPADTDIPDIYCILPLFSGCTGRLP